MKNPLNWKKKSRNHVSNDTWKHLIYHKPQPSWKRYTDIYFILFLIFLLNNNSSYISVREAIWPFNMGLLEEISEKLVGETFTPLFEQNDCVRCLHVGRYDFHPTHPLRYFHVESFFCVLPTLPCLEQWILSFQGGFITHQHQY